MIKSRITNHTSRKNVQAINELTCIFKSKSSINQYNILLPYNIYHQNANYANDIMHRETKRETRTKI